MAHRLRLTVFIFGLFGLVTLISTSALAQGAKSYADGTYRGVFIDSGGLEVAVQFTLKDHVVTAARYRLLQYKGTDYLKPQSQAEKSLAQQYQKALEHLQGKDIRGHINDLYQPGDFVGNVDGYSGATIRANKIRSAIQDGLNRGVYSF